MIFAAVLSWVGAPEPSPDGLIPEDVRVAVSMQVELPVVPGVAALRLPGEVFRPETSIPGIDRSVLWGPADEWGQGSWGACFESLPLPYSHRVDVELSMSMSGLVALQEHLRAAEQALSEKLGLAMAFSTTRRQSSWAIPAPAWRDLEYQVGQALLPEHRRRVPRLASFRPPGS